ERPKGIGPSDGWNRRGRRRLGGVQAGEREVRIGLNDWCHDDSSTTCGRPLGFGPPQPTPNNPVAVAPIRLRAYPPRRSDSEFDLSHTPGLGWIAWVGN